MSYHNESDGSGEVLSGAANGTTVVTNLHANCGFQWSPELPNLQNTRFKNSNKGFQIKQATGRTPQEQMHMQLENYMEELPEATQSRRVSFKTHHKSVTHTNGKLENAPRMRDHDHLRIKEKSCSFHYQPLEIPNGPIHAMEFLCRSWSPSASQFLQIFPPSSFSPTLGDNNMMETHVEKQGDKGKVEGTAESNRNILDRIKNISGWLRSKKITSLVKGQTGKKKDEVRLHTAQVHAALSVAQLAAAIAGFAANGSREAAQDINIHSTNGGIIWDKNIDAVASAAALVAAVCAEAAESAGARRAHIASAVSSGLANQTSVDMMALTATAATCLRAAATLDSRARVNRYSLRSQKMLKEGVQLSITMPSGLKEHQQVSIYVKHKQLMLRLRKKYLRGLLPTSKKYKIINVTDAAEEAQGYYVLKLKTNDGNIKLLFADRKQSSVWISTISNLLQMQNSC